MKKIITTCWHILTILLLTACNTQTDYNKLLVQVDSITETQLDSALHIMEKLPMDSLKTEADSAYYALLMTQVRDKSFIVQTNDSLIRSAVAYYTRTNDTKMLARAHYYAGCVYRDSQKRKEATTHYLTAQSLAEETGDKYLLSLIYNSLAYLYYTQDLNTQADSIYQLAEQIAIQLKDSILIAETLSQRGRIWMEKGETFYPKAEGLMLQALNIAELLPNERLKGSVYLSLSTLYDWMQDGEKSVEFARQNLATQSDSTTCYDAYELLGSAYYQTSQYDSARYYLLKALPAKDYATKAVTYMYLADVAKEQGDLVTSLEMVRNYSTYMDSLQDDRQPHIIASAEKDLQINRLQEKYSAFSRQTHYRIISVSISLIVIGIAVALILFFKKRKQKRRYQSEVEIRYQAGNILFEQSDIYRKMNHIIHSYKKNTETEIIHKEDWLQLITEADKCWNNITRKLQSEYNLTEDEIRLCCLYLTDLPVSHFCHILNCTRDAVYKKTDRILEQRMGFSHKEMTLKEIVRKNC